MDSNSDQSKPTIDFDNKITENQTLLQENHKQKSNEDASKTLNLQSNLGGKKKKSSKGKSQADSAQIKQVLLLICNSEDKNNRQNILKLVSKTLKPLAYNDTQTCKLLLKEILYDKYVELDKKQIKETNIDQMINLYIEFSQIFREGQVNPIIIDALYKSFEETWIQYASYKDKIFKSLVIKIWKFVPYQLLGQFLQKFCVVSLFQNLPIDQFLGDLSVLLFEKKIAQACEYLNLYIEDRQLVQALNQKIEKFEDSQIIPKLLKNDQIFTPFALNLITKNKRLKEKILNHPEIDLSIAVRLIENINDDVRNYKAAYTHVLQRHYRSIIHQHKSWYIIEDKISFQQLFIKWFVQQIEKIIEEYPPIEHKFQLPQSKDAIKSIVQSIKYRNYQNLEKPKEYVANPLYQFDYFGPAELIFSKINQTEYKDQFFCLSDYKISQKDVIFINQVNAEFQQMQKSIQNSTAIGFDTEFRCTSSKYDQQGIAIIQLAILQKCYLIDFLKLQKEPAFQNFLISLLENQKIKKVGHTLSSDFKFLGYTFKTQINVSSIIDLVDALKQELIDQKYSSLAFMCDKFLGKKLSKYQQRSNWNRRPLKALQNHYAASDAYVCLLIFQKLNLFESKQKTINNKKTGQKQIKVQKQVQIPKAKPFDFQKWEKFLQNPIFLADNMLKKLCSMMRNCGLDTQYINVRDYDLAISMAAKESRIIVTRDTKFYDKRNLQVPVYLLEERSDSEIMFKELIDKFKINLKNFTTLSRCVKCNSPELLIIQKEEAKKEINFKHEDSPIQVFWRCDKCKQIYWEGGQFAKAKERYAEFKK